jgi:hypothetical protein
MSTLSALGALLTGAAGAALILAAAVFFGKSFVQGWLARDVAKYQAALAQSNALEVEGLKASFAEKLETFKSRLQQEADRSLTRFERVHDHLHEVRSFTQPCLNT